MGDPLTAIPTNLGAADNLARLANSRSPKDMHAVGEKLEGVFMSMLVENMRTSMTEEGLFGDDVGSDTYAGLFDRYMGESLAKNSPLGITDMIVRAQAERSKEPDPCGAITDKYVR